MVDQAKLEKLKKLQEGGILAYPYSYNQTHHALEITSNFAKYEGEEVSVAGRIVGMRRMGSLYFVDLLDSSGKIQVIARSDHADERSMGVLRLSDTGDIIGVGGMVVKSQRGETSIEAARVEMLSKSLQVMPEKFHGLKDTELRYRKRYLDLIINPKVREFFVTRAKILGYMREFLDSRGYVEFETPVLQQVYGGANAKPFKTFYNALDTEVYMRISDELYLKRLVIGGFEKVYEVSKDFRNEDIDSTHNPEFTQIECYEAYKDYEDYMRMVEELLSGLVKSLFGTHVVDYLGRKIDFSAPFARVRWVERLRERCGIDVSELTDEEAVDVARREKLETSVKNSYHVADALFDKYIKPDLVSPTFVTDFPSYMCPLTKDKRGNGKLSERFELYVAGYEEANSYSELTDPIEQRAKFARQDEQRRKGDDEAPPLDEGFLEAVEYGMPPTAGLGISIDRITMILTGSASLKEVIAFPAVRPERKEVPGGKPK